jgi:hypothetical protein
MVMICKTREGHSFVIEGILPNGRYCGTLMVNGQPLMESIATKDQLINPPTPHDWREMVENRVNRTANEKNKEKEIFNELIEDFDRIIEEID